MFERKYKDETIALLSSNEVHLETFPDSAFEEGTTFPDSASEEGTTPEECTTEFHGSASEEETIP